MPTMRVSEAKKGQYLHIPSVISTRYCPRRCQFANAIFAIGSDREAIEMASRLRSSSRRGRQHVLRISSRTQSCFLFPLLSKIQGPVEWQSTAFPPISTAEDIGVVTFFSGEADGKCGKKTPRYVTLLASLGKYINIARNSEEMATQRVARRERGGDSDR